MQFTLECPPPSPPLYVTLLTLWALLLLPVGLPLLLWLQRSPRRASDVLLAVRRAPAGFARRLLDFGGWLFAAGSIVGLQLFAMVLMFALLSWFLESGVLGEAEGTTWLVAPTLAAGLLVVGWMVSERSPRAARDVLRVDGGGRQQRK